MNWEDTVKHGWECPKRDNPKAECDCGAEDQAKITWDIAEKETAKLLFREFICPMCYRLNPQHADADYGVGCKNCADKEFYCGKE